MRVVGSASTPVKGEKESAGDGRKHGGKIGVIEHQRPDNPVYAAEHGNNAGHQTHSLAADNDPLAIFDFHCYKFAWFAFLSM